MDSVFFCIIGNASLAPNRSKTTSSKSRQSRSQDRTLSPPVETVSHSNSSSTLIPTINPPIPDTTTPNGILPKLMNIISPLIKLIIQTISSLVRCLQTYPFKTTIIMFIFLIILFFHGFYLMKVTNRIEHRLQTLHHQWPSSIRNSLSSNAKEL